ncbi:MAG: Lrp/AsnC ligand binding domain-containing protein [Dehalococcoidia bacterium]|nr:MAG: Lrp/AsnC family transcriptional regulator [bacterium]MCE7927598.1 Lrp/AsnC family transcriptional regulator [Chloroflexi bacterium CFX7]MCK6565563.1 Lrp/AsnC ligand binding domain-containing protein [Dehalococcoidia bacterium]MCL4231362.1 Lrp/AsnC family transcriptional regulator [Dehalococcoidia bacterium]NUQ55432.1 Lrp/AsnC ligand binding domain-containing protein [Dehalococcoidia bacterium]
MSVVGWVLIETEVGRARAVAEAVAAIRYPGLQVLAADTVTGPHDVIARFEAADLDTFNSAMESTVEAIPGVEHTVTCMAFHAG